MDLKTKDNDLLIDKSTLDLETENDLLTAIMLEIIEHFDMQPADDIDFPEIYSKQREGMNSDDTLDLLIRKQDAERILKSYSEINLESIDVKVNGKQLDIKFRLTTGANGGFSI